MTHVRTIAGENNYISKGFRDAFVNILSIYRSSKRICRTRGCINATHFDVVKYKHTKNYSSVIIEKIMTDFRINTLVEMFSIFYFQINCPYMGLFNLWISILERKTEVSMIF